MIKIDTTKGTQETTQHKGAKTMKNKLLKKALTLTLSATLAFSSVATYAVDFTEPDVITEDAYADFSYDGFGESGEEETVYDEPDYYEEGSDGSEDAEEVFVSDYEFEEEYASEQYDFGMLEDVTEEETSEEETVSDEVYESSIIDEIITEDLEPTEQLASDDPTNSDLWTVVNSAEEFKAAFEEDTQFVYIKLGENFDGSTVSANYDGLYDYRGIYIDFNGNPATAFGTVGNGNPIAHITLDQKDT